MNFKTLLFFFFLCILTERTLSQTNTEVIKVMYNLKHLIDTAGNEYIEEPSELTIIGNTSYFLTTKWSISDSIKYYQMDESRHIPGRSMNFRVIKDLSTNSIKHYEDIVFRDFIYTEENINSFQWEITGLIDTLYGYPCQLAKINYGGRVWTSWFTSEIPISDGPYKFCGLPGLILKMKDDKNHWNIDFVSIERQGVREFNFDHLRSAKKLSLMELYNEKKNYNENPWASMEASGLISVSSEHRAQVIKQSKEYAKKNNNWIELYP